MARNELENFNERNKEKHIENLKLEKLIEELTNNCEGVSYDILNYKKR